MLERRGGESSVRRLADGDPQKGTNGSNHSLLSLKCAQGNVDGNLLVRDRAGTQVGHDNSELMGNQDIHHPLNDEQNETEDGS